MIQAAASRGEDLDGFVMDFVYPSIKGPSIKNRRVVLVDAWLSEKSYVQTSSLVTLRNGNELSLDFGVVDAQGAEVVAITSLVGGVGESARPAGSANAAGSANSADVATIAVVNPVTDEQHALPFVPVFDESELSA